MGHALGSALAIALTVGLTEGLRCSHPPAGATTLVASLGLLSLEGGVLAFMIGASVLAGCSLALRQKRLRG
jgi:CBS-domain-containing membrane protein